MSKVEGQDKHVGTVFLQKVSRLQSGEDWHKLWLKENAKVV